MSIDVFSRRPNVIQYAAREDGKTIIGEMADVSGNIDRVQRMRQAEINNATLGYCHVSIPLIELADWCNGLGLTLDEAVAEDAILDRFIADGHGKFKVKGGWQ